VLVHACRQRRLDPVPFLLALACAANIGSAATLIGNPQNMLIGQSLALSFGAYLGLAAVPVACSLLLLWLLLCRQHRREWRDAGAPPAAAESDAPDAAPAFDAWQTYKGLAAAALLLFAFLLDEWPRELLALTAAGVMLCNRRLHSTRMLGLVDWELLVLFIGLFVVNHAFARTGLAGDAVAWLARVGVDLQQSAPFFAATFVLSNIVSNVPAVMLLLPLAQDASGAAMLALVSTFAGNLLIVGSIANIIVVDAAARQGIVIDWRRHARTGIPVTLASLALCATFLWARTHFLS
jgi:Na+/H+ antiporter NhaD/arsenite permease-like protein